MTFFESKGLSVAHPTRTNLELLELIAEYRLLFTSQVALLTGTGLRGAQKKIKWLRNQGYLVSSYHDFKGFQGRPENVWSLSTRGADLLRNEGLIDSEMAKDRMTAEGITHVDHELLVNWFRIHLLQVDNFLPDLETEFISPNTPFRPLSNDGRPLIADRAGDGDDDSWFIPDGVFTIESKQQNKRVLFFLEVDRTTESIRSSKNSVNISQKIVCYHRYFRTAAYKRYEEKWMVYLNGFRVLFLTNTAQRKDSICSFIGTNPALGFVWITDTEQMFLKGVTARIWARGGKRLPLHSILGPTLACDLPLPNL